MKLRCWLCCLVSGAVAAMLLVLCGSGANAADKLKVLIVDGQNNHDFERTTPYLRHVLEATGRFQSYVATTPPRSS